MLADYERGVKPDVSVILARRRRCRVETLAQFLAGLEEGNVLGGHVDRRAGARIAADASRPLFHGKRTKTAEFDPVAAGQSRCDLVENRRYDTLDITLIQMGIRFRETDNQL